MTACCRDIFRVIVSAGLRHKDDKLLLRTARRHVMTIWCQFFTIFLLQDPFILLL